VEFRRRPGIFENRSARQGRALRGQANESDVNIMRFEMARRPKSRRVLSRGAKPFRRGERGEINSVADVVKSPEEIMRLILECQALLEPGQYDLERPRA
jgi:hypothetical protein